MRNFRFAKRDDMMAPPHPVEEDHTCVNFRFAKRDDMMAPPHPVEEDHKCAIFVSLNAMI